MFWSNFWISSLSLIRISSEGPAAAPHKIVSDLLRCSYRLQPPEETRQRTVKWLGLSVLTASCWMTLYNNVLIYILSLRGLMIYKKIVLLLLRKVLTVISFVWWQMETQRVLSAVNGSLLTHLFLEELAVFGTRSVGSWASHCCKSRRIRNYNSEYNFRAIWKQTTSLCFIVSLEVHIFPSVSWLWVVSSSGNV